MMARAFLFSRQPHGAVERAYLRENVFVNVASRGIRKTRKCCSLCPPRRQQIRQHWRGCGQISVPLTMLGKDQDEKILTSRKGASN